MRNNSKNKMFLPYYQGKTKHSDKAFAAYLRRRFVARVRQHFPQHFWIEPRPAKRLQYIRKHSRTHRYFLRFDLEAFYPSVNPQTVVATLLANYERLAGCPAPKRMQQRMRLAYGRFFQQQPLPWGLPLGTSLSAVTGPALLLGLCCRLAEHPFLCYYDDFLVFLPTKREITTCMARVLAELKPLGLRINPRKVQSGSFASESVSFTGFRYAGRAFSVDPEKVDAFRSKVIALTSLKKRYPSVTAFIKRLNSLVRGFGHYYKHGQVRVLFARLDRFIRSRVRRLLSRTRNVRNTVANVSLTNASLAGQYRLQSLLGLLEGKKKNSTIRTSGASATDVHPQWLVQPGVNLLEEQVQLLKKLVKQTETVSFLLGEFA